VICSLARLFRLVCLHPDPTEVPSDDSSSPGSTDMIRNGGLNFTLGSFSSTPVMPGFMCLNTKAGDSGFGGGGGGGGGDFGLATSTSGSARGVLAESELEDEAFGAPRFIARGVETGRVPTSCCGFFSFLFLDDVSLLPLLLLSLLMLALLGGEESLPLPDVVCFAGTCISVGGARLLGLSPMPSPLLLTGMAVEAWIGCFERAGAGGGPATPVVAISVRVSAVLK
jgi:hypothetical protein